MAIKEGSRRVQVLGPLPQGPRLSIGSLGAPHGQSVGTFARERPLHRTSNAARVKTRQGVMPRAQRHARSSAKGATSARARSILLPESIPSRANETDAVAVSDVKVSGIVGWQTSAAPRVVAVDAVRRRRGDGGERTGCSNVVRCLNVVPVRAPPAPTATTCRFRLDIARPMTEALGDVPCVPRGAHP